MALLTELTAVVAKVEGVPETFVASVARYLREADHIRQGGRGLSAARMLPRDAAALIIAVNATRLAKDAVEAFESYGALKWSAITDFDELPDSGPWNLIRTVLKEDVTLFDALSSFIKLSVWHDSYRPPLDSAFAKGEIRLDVTFARPRHIVQIEIVDLTEKGLGVMLRGVFFSEPSEDLTHDRRDLVTITHRTILEVGEALSSF